jgi:hypothetical protein
VESHLTEGQGPAPKHSDSLETGNLLGDDPEADPSPAAQEDDGDDDFEMVNPNIKPEQVSSSDPYAGLDVVFGANATPPTQEPESKRTKLRNSYRQSVQVFAELPVGL